MTTCPDLSLWRAYLDGELPAADRARLDQHLAACTTCPARLTELAATAAFAGQAIATLAPLPAATATDLALRRVSARLDERPAASWTERLAALVAPLLATPARLALTAGLSGLVVLLVLALTPMGTQALQALSVFRVERFKAVTIEIDPATLPKPAEMRKERAARGQPVDPLRQRQELERELAAAGITITSTIDERTAREVDSLAAARRAAPAGTRIQTISAVPAPFQAGEPRVYVADPSKTSVRVDLTKLRQAAADHARTAPRGTPTAEAARLPGIDSNLKEITATLTTSFAVVQVYGEGDQALVLAQGPSPELAVVGVDILAIRDALVAMPGLSSQTRAQIASIKDNEWTTTLIIPVPEGAIVRDVTVGGQLGNLVGGERGLLILGPDRKQGVVLWKKDGILYAVGGGHGEDVLMHAANSVK